MATVGYGDINLLGEPAWFKLYDIVLMATTAVLLASSPTCCSPPGWTARSAASPARTPITSSSAGSGRRARPRRSRASTWTASAR
jgi:hypothetical protein